MDMAAFARDWEAGWNSHDLERILSHYRDDIVFRSRKAIPIMGRGEIVGLKNLRAYWSAALAQQPDLRFRVDQVLEGLEMMVIAYTNHRNLSAAETLYFDNEGKVFRAAACHQL